MIRLMAVTIFLAGCWYISPTIEPVSEMLAIQQVDNHDAPTHDKIVKLLRTRYNEEVVNRGLASNGALVEVFATSSGNTWTIVMTFPNGTSMLMMTGEWWSLHTPGDDL